MTTLARINTLSSTIALEASVPNVSVEGLMDKLPNFFTNVKSFVGDLFNFTNTASVGFLDTRKIPTVLAHHEFATLAPIGVFVPPGLRVTYIDYLEALEHAQKVAEVLAKETLAPFNVWIALQINNPENLNTLHSERSIAGFKLHDIDKPRAQLASCFDKNAVHSELAFDKAFRRVSDYRFAVEKANELNEKLNAISKTEISRLISEISVNLDKLFELMKTEPERYRANANTIRLIATVCGAMARECEFFSVYHFQVLTALTALKDSEDKLKDLV